ncbi:MAG: SH3 domain-containing protein [Candidatus Pacebacteria bacterium]|nr:SH3 domain-containing protein [Candidatus Paceibacterota bacterium]MBP9780559.1 SH3 domain-containing protein [Candidatus Paceibacterota bacterium]
MHHKPTFLQITFLALFSFATLYTNARASETIKTITVNFATAPTTYTVTKLPLKYGKDFAYSWTFDDGYIEGYRNAFKYFNGGTADADLATYPGRYSTDGAGNLVAFNGSFALNLVNTSFVDTHYDTTSSFSYGEMRKAYDGGWDLLNQGWQGIATPSPSNTVINYPAPHGSSTIDYEYEITNLNDVVKDKIGITYDTTMLTLPSGEQNYIDDALAIPYIKAILSQATVFNFTGGPYTIPTGSAPVDVNDLISDPDGLTDYFMYRNLVNSPSSTPDATNVSSYATLIDLLASSSTGGVNKWGHIFTHRVWCGTTTCGTAGSMSGANMYWPKWKELIDYTYDTYGAGGTDAVWVAGQEEVFQYLETVKGTDVSTSQNGTTLTITLDVTDVPTDIRRRSLSLEVDADAVISSISYGSGDFTYTTENTSTGLINLEMGEYYLTDLNSKVEDKVEAAEQTLLSGDVSTAQTWVDFLDAGATKTAFQNRIDAIPTPDRTFQVAVGQNANGTSSSIGGLWNKHSKISSADAAITLVDTTSTSSSITWKVQSNFNSKFDGSTNSKGSITNNNTGVYPDTYIKQGVLLTTNGGTGTFRLSGLNTAKVYNFKMMGSTLGRDDRYDSKTKATYQAVGLTTDSATLQAFQNTHDFVVLEDIAPTAGGLIDIHVTQFDTADGKAILSAFSMTEIDPAPVITFTADDSTLLEGESTNLNWSATNTTTCSANWTVSTSSSGVQSISPTSSTTYSIECTGPGGTTTGTHAVTVNSDLTSLTSAIATAQALYDGAVEGTSLGQYAVGAKATLLSAINVASAITNTQAQSVVNTAITTLNTAVSVFESTIVTSVPSSSRSGSVATSTTRVIQAPINTLPIQNPVDNVTKKNTARVKVLGLRLRQIPGGKILKILNKSQQVEIVEKKIVNNVEWANVKLSESENGWVSNVYLEGDTSTADTPVSSNKIKTTASILNIRKTPNGSILYKVRKGAAGTVVESDAKSVWVKVLFDDGKTGYVHKDFIQ